MAIHHDKLSYGKLVSSREDVSEERLLEMARLLSRENDCSGHADEESAKEVQRPQISREQGIEDDEKISWDGKNNLTNK